MKHRTKLRIWSWFTPSDRAMLTTPATPVELSALGTPEQQTLIDQMVATMRQAEGIGLAAPQIGRSTRLAVVAAEVAGRSEALVLVNPIIKVTGAEQEEGEEGCLSIPGVFGQVPRAMNIAVKAFDRHGQPQSVSAEGLLARVILHEVDHLNGILFTSRATAITKGQEKVA